MASSGTYNLDPTLVVMMDEAFERAGMDPRAIGDSHILSALQSINFLVSEWETLPIKLWRVIESTQALTAGEETYELPVGAQEVLRMMLRRSNVDTEVLRKSRDDYLLLPNKTDQGRPDRYCLDRSTIDHPMIHLWPVPENSTDVLVMHYMRRIEDPGSPGSQPNIPFQFREAFVAGLAAKFAAKWKIDRAAALQEYYRGPPQLFHVGRLGGVLGEAMRAHRDRSPVRFILRR